MSKLDEIKEIISIVLRSPIRDFSVEYDDVKIAFVKEGASNSIPTQQEIQIDSVQVQKVPSVAVTKQINAVSVVEDIIIQDYTESPLKEISSMVVGTFYSSSDPNSSAFVKLGDIVTADTVVGVIEAMKLYNEVYANISGEIVEILVKDGQLIDYGQPLFKVRPS